MANITRFDPFEDTFPDLMRTFFRSPRLWRGPESDMEIKIDVSEDDRSYKVRANIPGVKKEDISVAIDGNAVTISAEIKQQKEEKTERSLRSERFYGAMSRSFTLASAIDDKAAAARYVDGVLELVLPKKENAGQRKLRIE